MSQVTHRAVDSGSTLTTMSFLIGPVSGALVAGGVSPLLILYAVILKVLVKIYYGFSNLIESRTIQHRDNLHMLSQKLVTPPSEHDVPPTAAARVVTKPLTALVKQRWNEKVSELYTLTGRGGDRASSWGREVLYGGDAGANGANQSP
ncbi:hypothetical protein H4582DRAFT_1990737 [Lactarius indigo]|nr:hypothetical protein H4582DRAFT_2044266 [Lactarius indigo]KAI9433026.1 hypothetical protein H4582DRAFT_1990737 [Lactarius indigo]